MQVDDEGASLSSGPGDNSGDGPQSTSRKDNTSSQEDASFLQNKLYSVIASKSLGGFELVLLHSPWHESADCWRGEEL